MPSMSRYPKVIKTSMARTSTGGTARASAPAIGSSPACGERWRGRRTHHIGVCIPRRTISSAPGYPVKSTACELDRERSAPLYSMPRSRRKDPPRVGGPLPVTYCSGPPVPQRRVRDHRRRRAVSRARLRPSEPYPHRRLPARVMPLSYLVGASNRLSAKAVTAKASGSSPTITAVTAVRAPPP